MTVCSGSPLTQASVECKTQRQYGEVFQRIQQQFQLDAPDGPHWVRIFVGFLHGELIGAEAILDGREWGEATRILREWPWAPSAEYESLRHFLIALPERSRIAR